MGLKDHTKSELRTVTPEQIKNVKMRNPNTFKLFTLKDPLNKGVISQVSVDGTTINQGILGLRNKGSSLASGLSADLSLNREQTIGDPSTFVERRTDPLRQEISQQGEALTKRLGQTGVAGEFAQQTQESFRVSAQQKIDSGEQLALDEFTALSNNLDQTEGGILRLMENIDFSAFTQDLQARGLSLDLKNQLTRLEQGRIGIDNQQKNIDRANAGNLLSLFGNLFGG